MSKKAEELSNQFIGHPYEADEDFTITLARSAYRQGYEQAEKDTIERAVSWISANLNCKNSKIEDYVNHFKVYMTEE